MLRQTATFCTVFPTYRDFHFFKDPGQIPFRFAKIGYKARIVCYCSSAEKFAETGKYLDIVKIPGTWFNRKFNAGLLKYLLLHAREIDILNVFHYSWSSLFLAFIYKTINRKGFVYLKLDYCAYALRKPGDSDSMGNGLPDTGTASFKGRIKAILVRRFFVRRVDLWSVEDEQSREILESRHDFLRGKLITVYNGHTSDLPSSVEACPASQKEDIILTAGRLGSWQKATEVLLEAFKSIAPATEYDLHLAGAAESGFESYLESYLKENPFLKARIKYHGPLERKELYSLYCRSKIFCLPSRFEGMAIVFPEAMYYGNVIITTDNTSLKPLVEKHHFGLTVARDNSAILADALLKMASDRETLDEMAANARETASTLLTWDRIIRCLNDEITVRSTETRK